MHETPNSYLSVCLVMMGIRVLTFPYTAPILYLQRSSLGRYETLLRPNIKLTHAHLIKLILMLYVLPLFCIKASIS